MSNIEHISSSSGEYSISQPDQPSDQTLIFYPGMACNRFGHPMHPGPRGAVKDLVDVAAQKYNLIFPEINMARDYSGSDPIRGLTVEEQNQRATDVLLHVSKKVELNKIVYVGQSLGCLAVAQLVQCGIEVESQQVILWGPPTLEGEDHRKMLVSKFSGRDQTEVDDKGGGVLQFGNGRLMRVSPDYWQSIDKNSLRFHHEGMLASVERAEAICASEDDYYPNNAAYMSVRTPGIKRLEISGKSHTFRDDDMRIELKGIMKNLLGATD